MTNEQKLFQYIYSWIQGGNPDAFHTINKYLKNFYPICATYIKQITADTEAEKIQFLINFKTYIELKLLNSNPIYDPEWQFVNFLEFINTELFARNVYAQQQNKIKLIYDIESYIYNYCQDQEILQQNNIILHSKTHKIALDSTIPTQVKMHHILHTYSLALLLQLLTNIKNNIFDLNQSMHIYNNLQVQLYNITNKLTNQTSLTDAELEVFATNAWLLNRLDILKASITYGLRIPQSKFFTDLVQMMYQNYDVFATLTELTSIAPVKSETVTAPPVMEALETMVTLEQPMIVKPEIISTSEPPVVTAALEPEIVPPSLSEDALEPLKIVTKAKFQEITDQYTIEEASESKITPVPKKTFKYKPMVITSTKPLAMPHIVKDYEKLSNTVQQLNYDEFNKIISTNPELVLQIRNIIISKLNEKLKGSNISKLNTFFSNINITIEYCLSLCKTPNLSDTAVDILIKKIINYHDIDFCQHINEKLITDHKTLNLNSKKHLYLQLQNKIKHNNQWLDSEFKKYTQFIVNNPSKHNEALIKWPIAKTEIFKNKINSMPLYSHPLWQKIISINSNSEKLSTQDILVIQAFENEITYYSLNIPENDFSNSIFGQAAKDNGSIELLKALKQNFAKNFDGIIKKTKLLLHDLITNYNDPIFNWILDQIDPAYLKEIINIQDQNNHTPLFTAINLNLENKVKKLLESGANEERFINNTYFYGSTIFTLSIMHNLENIAEFFLKHSLLTADNIDNDGNTALHLWAKFMPHNITILKKLLEKYSKNKLKIAQHLNNKNDNFLHIFLNNPNVKENDALNILQYIFNTYEAIPTQKSEEKLINHDNISFLIVLLFTKNCNKQTIFTISENREHTKITEFLSKQLIEQIKILEYSKFYDIPDSFKDVHDYFNQESTDCIIINKIKDKKYALAEQYIALRRKTRDEIYKIFTTKSSTDFEAIIKESQLKAIMNVFSGEDYVSIYIEDDTLFNFIFDIEKNNDKDLETLRHSTAIQKIIKIYPVTHLKYWTKIYTLLIQNKNWQQYAEYFTSIVKKYNFDINRKDIKSIGVIEELININNIQISEYMFSQFNIKIEPIHLSILSCLKNITYFKNFDLIFDQYNKQHSVNPEQYPDFKKIEGPIENNFDLLECAIFKSFSINNIKWILAKGMPANKLYKSHYMIDKILSNIYNPTTLSFEYCYNVIEQLLLNNNKKNNINILQHRDYQGITCLNRTLLTAPRNQREENFMHKIIELMYKNGANITNLTVNLDNILHHAIIKDASLNTIKLLKTLILQLNDGENIFNAMLTQKNIIDSTPEKLMQQHQLKNKDMVKIMTSTKNSNASKNKFNFN